MPELQQLRPAEAITLLRATPRGGRGFLGLDPVTQNDPLLLRRIADTGMQLFAVGDTVLGYAANPDNPRQAFVATTSEDGAALVALAEHLRVYRRCTSLVCHAAEGEPAVAALLDCGFRSVGLLREHDYRSGAYHDVHVYHVAGAQLPCAS